MPAKGFKAITVKEDVYDNLHQLSDLYGYSISDLLSSFTMKNGLGRSRIGAQRSPCFPSFGSRVRIPAAASETFHKSFIKTALPGRAKPKNYSNSGPSFTVSRDQFFQYCTIDLRLKRNTVLSYIGSLRSYFSKYNKFDLDSLRAFLSGIENPSTYNNYLKAFNNWARFVAGSPLPFKFTRVDPPLIFPPSDKDLRVFYSALEWDYERLAFVGYCATGLRRSELLDLRLDQLDLSKRAIYPGHSSQTKRALVTFYNSEFEGLLNEWFKARSPKSERLFSISGSSRSCLFIIAQKRTGLDITPQKLRQWFVKAMGDRGVPDRYIDYFTGHIPRSVLARHYTDYDPKHLKEIYERASLKVLTP